MAHWFKTLFAATGTKTAVPDAADPSGYISYDIGYGPDYQRVLGTDPLAKTIERDKLNQVLYDITGAVQQYQTHGFPDYIDATANGGVAYAYAIDAIVLFTDKKNYVNTIAGNTNDPSVSGWIELGSVSTTTHNMTANADYTLSATENKYLRISITDTSVFLTAGRNIIVDNSQRRFLAVNNTLQILTFKTSAGTGISVPSGQAMELLCDGTNVIVVGYYPAYNVDTTSFIANTLASGAIIEHGSNANGYYVKYADGTMLCYHPTYSVSQTLSTLLTGEYYDATGATWTFPAVFIDTNISASAMAQTTGVLTKVHPNSWATTNFVFLLSTGATQTAKTYTCRLIAIGRWK